LLIYSTTPRKTANMKNIIAILAIVFVISGCNSKRFLEAMGLEEEITNVIQIRNEIAYLPNENEPFTGKYEEYYSTNGQKKSETNYQDGKQNGLFTSWYENGKKENEENYQDGKQNGLVTGWYENGQKESETNFKDGKVNGLYSVWYENGQKKTEINYKDGEINGLFTWWYENGQKMSETNYIDGKVNGVTISGMKTGRKSETNKMKIDC
jgi:Uncharacterized protein conserved in bacteria